MSVSSIAMEGEEQEEHHNETESPEQAGDNAGTAAGASRFYECVFCKRGFSTAQALGGHMNIHRRDRTKLGSARSSPPAPRRAAEEAYHPYSREQRRTFPQAVESSSSNYAVYFPGSSSTSGSSGDKRELELAGEELQLGLGEPGQETRKEKGKDQVGSEDLDLELRLGHSRGHESS